MTAHVPSNHEVETFSGRYVDTKRPDPATIDLEDIAHALGNVCRYGGHSAYHYSVAQHAVYVSIRMERQGYRRPWCLAALHHDDSEAYLSDIPRPMKKLLGRAYEILTDRMDKAIYTAVGLAQYGVELNDFHDERVKDADNWALFVEAKHLLPSQGINWAGSQLDDWGVRQDGLPSRIITPDYFLGEITPSTAKKLYLDRHKELTT
jgi:hypothetical protein